MAVTLGTKPILVVKVTDSANKAHPRTTAEISDDVFGTDSDPVNLKTQLAACSFNQLIVQPGLDPPDSHEVAPGVIEVTIGVTLSGNSRGTIRNAVTTAVQSKLGHSLPGPYQQVMYVLHSCDHTDCGWAAYGE